MKTFMMTEMLGIRIKRAAQKLFPLIFFLGAVWAVGDELPSVKDMKFGALLEAWPLMAFLLLGTALNWGLEAYKWYLLGNSSLGLSYEQALKGVLVGTAVSMWMPGRVGSWLGKLSFVPSADRKTAIHPLLTSGAAQFFVTVSMAGFAALSFWSFRTLPSFDIPAEGLLLYGGIFTLLFCIGGASFYKILHSRSGRAVLMKAGLRRGKLLSIRELPGKLYGRVLALAYMRYSVFLLQFVLALRYWVTDASLSLLLLSVPIVLFIVSVLPSFVLAKLGVREMVIVAVMAPFFGQESSLILASFSIWLVNLAVPALFGAGLLLERSYSSSSSPASADR